jgi:hypothetical protein
MKTLERVKFISVVFIGGAKEQLKQQWTIGAAAGIGLAQGFKYNGSIKRGVTGGIATLAVLAAANGFSEVMYNWDKIKAL